MIYGTLKTLLIDNIYMYIGICMDPCIYQCIQHCFKIPSKSYLLYTISVCICNINRGFLWNGRTPLIGLHNLRKSIQFLCKLCPSLKFHYNRQEAAGLVSICVIQIRKYYPHWEASTNPTLLTYIQYLEHLQASCDVCYDIHVHA